MLAAAIQRAVQRLVAARVSAVLQAAIPDLNLRLLVSCAAAILALVVPKIEDARAINALTLTVATSTIMSAVSSEQSPGITLLNLCMVLLAGEVLVSQQLIPKEVSAAFLGNAKYLFAYAATSMLLSSGWPQSIPLLLAPCLAGVTYSGWAPSPTLAEALLNTSLEIPRRLFIADLPKGIMRLPSIIMALCLVRPLYTKLGLLGSTYSFVLYCTADELASALKAELGDVLAALAAPTLLLLAPIPVYKTVLQIAAVAITTDLVMDAVQAATRVDPVPGLGGVLVLMEMLLRLVQPSSLSG